MVSGQEVFLVLIALREDRPGMWGSCGGPGLDTRQTLQTLSSFLPVLDPYPTSNSLGQLPGLPGYRAGLLLQL